MKIAACVHPLKTYIFRLLAALLEVLLELLGGGWTLDFSECPIDPLGGGGWTLDFSESPTDPPGGGGWTLDFKKERNQVEGGGCYKVTLVLCLLM